MMERIKENRILVFIIVLCVIVQIVNPYFLSGQNILGIFRGIAIEGVIAIGMAYLIILGEIDLSVGAIMSISCCFAIYLQPFGIVPAILGGLAIATLAGFLNGLLVVKTKVNSLPVTLGTMVIMNGIVFVITKSQSVPGMNKNFIAVADTMLFNINLVIFFFVILVVIFEYVLQKGIFGRNIIAIGGNKNAAEYAGLKVDRIRIQVFMLTGLLSGVAGIMTASRYNIASGLIGGQTALTVITAVLIGGISLSGGEGSIVKAFFGFLFMGVLNNAMQLLKFPTDLQPVIIGVMLIVILALDAVNIRKNQFK